MPGSGEGDAETLTPEEAFRLFGHDLRIDVLLALWRAPDHSLSYSELREAVGERDSGKFNYHLSKLVDRFVEHADDEYRLRYAGHRVIDAIQSGVFHETPTVGPVELDATCPSCGSPLTFDYADHNGSVRCPDCGTSVLDYAFDPGGVAERTPDEVVDAFDRRTRHFWRFALSGVCVVCAGRVEGDLRLNPNETLDDDHYLADHPAVISLSCRRCSFYSHLPVGVTLLSHPAVPGVLYDHGVDVRERPLWELDFVVDPSNVAVREADPPSVAITVRAGRETLWVRVDDALTVRSIERELSADRPSETR